MHAQGLLLGLLPPRIWQDQSTSLQETVALRQAPACCSSSRAGELTPEKPPGEVSKASPLPTSHLVPHPYLSCPRAPFPKWG